MDNGTALKVAFAPEIVEAIALIGFASAKRTWWRT
jgi:hypothetical protein